jgi:hypothetical protein
MLQQLFDNAVLGGFSLLFRVAVFALKRRHSSVAGPDNPHVEAVVQHRSVLATRPKTADGAFAARPI